MGTMEVVIEELQALERIPGVIQFGKGVHFAGGGLKPIMQGPIEPLQVHRASWLHIGPQRGGGCPLRAVVHVHRDAWLFASRWTIFRSILCARQYPLAIGPHVRELKLFEPIEQTVQIVQKTIKDRPTDKLYDAFISLLAGAQGLVEIKTRLRADAA